MIYRFLVFPKPEMRLRHLVQQLRVFRLFLQYLVQRFQASLIISCIDIRITKIFEIVVCLQIGSRMGAVGERSYHRDVVEPCGVRNLRELLEDRRGARVVGRVLELIAEIGGAGERPADEENHGNNAYQDVRHGCASIG